MSGVGEQEERFLRDAVALMRSLGVTAWQGIVIGPEPLAAAERMPAAPADPPDAQAVAREAEREIVRELYPHLDLPDAELDRRIEMQAGR